MGRDTLSVARRMHANAKRRALLAGIPFTITVEDIYVPEICPVLGFPLMRHNKRGGSPNSPSLDRIVAARGYVKGNIIVVSHLANTIKSSASPDQIRKVYEFYLRLQLSSYDDKEHK